MQTAAFDLEMSRASQHTQASGAVLAAIAFRTLADTSRSFALMHRVEAAYDRQFNRALTLLLKLRKAPDLAAPIDPPLELVTEARDDDSPIEPNFDTSPGNDPTCNEQVPDITSNAPRFEMNPISPSPQPQDSDAPAPSKQPAISGFRMPDTRHESDLGRTSLAENTPPVEVASPLSGP
jgi:cell division septation protein DedD